MFTASITAGLCFQMSLFSNRFVSQSIFEHGFLDDVSVGMGEVSVTRMVRPLTLV
jgi:hypothetical protein